MKHTRLRLQTAASAAAISVSLVALSPVTGCKVDQVAEVATYRRVLNAPPTTAPAPVLPADYPLTLREAMRLANEHNESLSIQGETYLQALIDKRRAAANFLPTVSGGGSYSLSGSSRSRSNTITFEGNDTSHRLQASVSEQINLFNGFADVANYRRAEYAIRQREYLLLDLQQSILLDVAATYYDVLRAERSVEVLEYTVEVDNQRIRDQQVREQQGVARPLDVAQIEADAAATRATLATARTNVLTGRATLAYLLGVDEVSGPLSDDVPVPGRLGSMQDWIGRAYANRHDLLAAEYATNAARQNITVAVSQYYPSVDLSLSQFLYRDPAGGSNWSLNIPVNVPIFSAGRIRADVRSAWSQFRQAALNEAQRRRQVLQDVRVAYELAEASAARLRDLEYGVVAARNAFELAEQSYAVGTGTNLERIAARDQYLNAQLRLVNEQLSQKLSSLELLRAAGRMSLTPPTSQPAAQPTTVPATRPIP